MRTIERAGRRFTVVDALYNNWDFWGAFANGSWEKFTIDEISRLPAGSLLFDVGAWIGPISLWAASQGVNVVALEPDPTAYQTLLTNIAQNNYADLIKPKAVAVTDVTGLFTLHTEVGGGDSSSSLTRPTMPESVEVLGVTMHELIDDYGEPDLIKMDIEGGEALLLPVAGGELRELGIPLLLSLHTHWFPEGTREPFEAEMAKWTRERKLDETGFYRP